MDAEWRAQQKAEQEEAEWKQRLQEESKAAEQEAQAQAEQAEKERLKRLTAEEEAAKALARKQAEEEESTARLRNKQEAEQKRSHQMAEAEKTEIAAPLKVEPEGEVKRIAQPAEAREVGKESKARIMLDQSVQKRVKQSGMSPASQAFVVKYYLIIAIIGGLLAVVGCCSIASVVGNAIFPNLLRLASITGPAVTDAYIPTSVAASDLIETATFVPTEAAAYVPTEEPADSPTEAPTRLFPALPDS
jgi:phage-related minor tail protein